MQATTINEEMKIATVYALADLTKKAVPEVVNAAYSIKKLQFGKDYIIPKPLDPRLLTHGTGGAKAAMDRGCTQTNYQLGRVSE